MTERPLPQQTLTADSLQVQVYADRGAMGAAAAWDVVDRIQRLLREQDRVRMVFAAAPSQNEMLATLAAAPDVDWGRIEAFHMDEYIGLPEEAPQRFGRFLRQALFDRVLPARVAYIDGNAREARAECARYAALLTERPIDIVCAGIGENGHMAFNDPHVTDFSDPHAVKVVELDEVCRHQQVHDGAFATLDAVPTHAITLTMPTLMSARWIYCVVPGPTKADAVGRTVHDAINKECPATAMRRHPAAVLYVDADAATRL